LSVRRRSESCLTDRKDSKLTWISNMFSIVYDLLGDFSRGIKNFLGNFFGKLWKSRY
jgi:hypothetical protein